jgi:superfamily II DNA or RNA helicase
MSEQPRLEERVDKAQPELTARAWGEALTRRLSERPTEALAEVLPALHQHPHDPYILLLTIIAALLDEKPQIALRHLDRFLKRYEPHGAEVILLRAVAFAEQGLWALAAQQVRKRERIEVRAALRDLPIYLDLYPWFHDWLDRIEREERKSARSGRPGKASAKSSAKAAAGESAPKAAKRTGAKPKAENLQPIEAGSEAPVLPRAAIKIPVTIALDGALDAASGESAIEGEAGGWEEARRAQAEFRLRYEHTQLGLFQGFDDLLCLPTLRGVEIYWYQVEAVRKVLKLFRGRVLLADEVGLGKTIEAGMALKEYLLRGMAERVLILTPATLVGQWQEEMATKFGVEFAVSYDASARNDPERFWGQPRVIASIATARRAENQPHLIRQHYDLVIVDEAHHLKNRQTANWKLVDALNNRFLLLLSATPVQNSLIELYNLLTLLKPGLFKTEKEFRASYVTSGKPRVPANRDRMRDLMREVMIRNTRSLVEVRLPPRHAVTLKVDPLDEEDQCYRDLSQLIADRYEGSTTQRRLALRHLLSAAGSTATTAAAAIGRYLEGHRGGREWHELAERYAALEQSGKERALLGLLEKNPDEKKIVFVHHRETLRRISALLAERGVGHAVFEGGMSGPDKDAAVERFRGQVPLLVCTESGGEGRNLQFCNTMVNFDLPWNPMAIEQRIGRIHRIGQTRDVFVFNLVARGTLEEQILAILDEKINMFELVVGEIDSILGEMSEEQDFAELVFRAWVGTTEEMRPAAFAELGAQMAEARAQYEQVKALDEELFGEDFIAV